VQSGSSQHQLQGTKVCWVGTFINAGSRADTGVIIHAVLDLHETDRARHTQRDINYETVAFLSVRCHNCLPTKDERGRTTTFVIGHWSFVISTLSSPSQTSG
jgi:hypothetical protein